MCDEINGVCLGIRKCKLSLHSVTFWPIAPMSPIIPQLDTFPYQEESKRQVSWFPETFLKYSVLGIQWPRL